MKTLALLVPVAAALAACASPVPVAQNFDLSHQKVARTAHHWDVVADDVVTQTLQAVAEKAQLQHRPIYVEPGRATAFETAFRSFMITRLVDQGVEVSVCKTAPAAGRGFSAEGPAVNIRYDVQYVRHAGSLPDYQPPRYTLLAAGVAVVRNVILGGNETAGTIGGIALGEWGAGYVARPTQAEIIVTTTIAENNRFVARQSDVYYVPEDDSSLFIRRVAARSLCPGDSPADQAKEDAADRDAQRELARQELFEREMRRTNPQWKPHPLSSSY